jgi:hypothetical protein
MSYTLSEAAAACGVNRSTVLRALKSGKISGTRDEAGAWHVEAVELHRIFPPVAAAAAVPSALPQHAQAEALIAQLREALCDMRQQRGDALADRDRWREAFENQQRLALAAPVPAPAPADAGDRLYRAWRWLRKAG